MDHKDPLSFYPFRMHGTFVEKANKLVAKFIVNQLGIRDQIK